MDTAKPRISIIMRSHNDADVIGETLQALRQQTIQDFELWNHDSRSNDGTMYKILEHNCIQRIRLNNPRNYNPGTVLNEAVRLCKGEIIVFLNSDATPTTNTWLERLIGPLDDPRVGAVFGKQSARPDCHPLFDKDTQRAFGDGSVSANWIHFFSMANSAARRSIVKEFCFETRIQYSEDIEWSLRLKQQGYRIRYVPEAEVVHSHNYTLLETYRRQFGEGTAEAFIFNKGEINFSFVRYALLPFVIEVIRDIFWSVKKRSVSALFHSLPLRLCQKLGRWHGACRSLSAMKGV